LPCLGRAAATPSHAAHSLCRRCLWSPMTRPS
jgi:hypothetical protein